MADDNEEPKFSDEYPYIESKVPHSVCCAIIKYCVKYFHFNIKTCNDYRLASFPVNFCPVCGREAIKLDEEFKIPDEDIDLPGSIYTESNIRKKACCEFLNRSSKYIKIIFSDPRDHLFFPINFCPICGEERTGMEGIK